VGWYSVGVHHLRLSLESGESKRVIFLLGYFENPEDEKFSPLGLVYYGWYWIGR
jgi:cellobiose phosphorylase